MLGDIEKYLISALFDKYQEIKRIFQNSFVLSPKLKVCMKESIKT